MVLRDAVEVVAQSLERMRTVKSTVGGDVLDSMTRSEKERAIVRELVASGELHPALLPGESEVTVLSRMLMPIIPHLVPQRESQIVVNLIRELLAGGVLRPLAGLCTPKWVNKGILMTLSRLDLLQQCDVDSRIVQRFTRQAEEGSKNASVKAATPSRFKRWYEAQRERRRANLASNMRDIPIYDLKGLLDFDDVQLESGSVAQVPILGASLHDHIGYHDAQDHCGTCTMPQPMPEGRMGADRAESNTNGSPTNEYEAAGSSGHTSLAGSLQDAQPRAIRTDSAANVNPDDESDEWRPALWQRSDSWSSSHGTPRPVEERSAFETAFERRKRDAARSADEATPSASIPTELSLERRPHSRRVAAGIIGAETVSAPTGPYVAFAIKVRSAAGESWTVQRRYKNFERLHRRIRRKAGPAELKLPPKRLLASALSDRLVNDRRTMLDSYLKALLANEILASSGDVQDFLSQHSNEYAPSRESAKLKPVGGALSATTSQISTLPYTASAQGLVNVQDANKQPRISGDQSGAQLSTSQPERKSSTEVMLQQKAGRYRRRSTPMTNGNDEDGYEEDIDVISMCENQHVTNDGSSSHDGSEDDASDVGDTTAAAAAVATVAANDGDGNAELDDEALRFEDDEQFFQANTGKRTNAGLSAHILRLIDRVFCLRSIGAFQWAIYSIMHHVLSALHVDDRLDDLLGSQLASLRSEGSAVTGLRWLRDTLWPGGVWFQRAALPNDSEADLAMEADNTLHALLRLGEESAVVNNIIGRTRYRESIHDVYEMLQSPTFCAQIGYELTEVLLATLFPEHADTVVCEGGMRIPKVGTGTQRQKS